MKHMCSNENNMNEILQFQIDSRLMEGVRRELKDNDF